MPANADALSNGEWNSTAQSRRGITTLLALSHAVPDGFVTMHRLREPGVPALRSGDSRKLFRYSHPSRGADILLSLDLSPSAPRWSARSASVVVGFTSCLGLGVSPLIHPSIRREQICTDAFSVGDFAPGAEQRGRCHARLRTLSEAQDVHPRTSALWGNSP